jgi:hypothetical protein
MNVQRRNFLFVVTLVGAAAVTPTLGQDVAPAVGLTDSRAQSAASIPDLSGIWGRNWIDFEPPSSGPSPVVSELRRPDGTMILNPRVGNYTNPILKPHAAETVKKNGEMEARGDVLPNPNNQCWSEWNPFTLSSQFGMQMLQQKHQITLLYLHDHQVRHVRMNVPHSEHPTPTWQGESVGHYEGDTLVIDTIALKVGPLDGRFVRHAVHRGSPCGGTLSAD